MISNNYRILRGISLAIIKGVNTRRTKNQTMAKEMIGHIPLIRRKPAFEQPFLQLPLPSPLSEMKQEAPRKKEETERGVWIIDI